MLNWTTQMPDLAFTLREIAYDNGMVNRNDDEDATLTAMMSRLQRKYLPSDIRTLDAALGRLTEQEKITVATGEEDEADSVLGFHGIDPKYGEMLNVAFDG